MFSFSAQPTEGTTINHETVPYDYSDTTSISSTTTVGTESNEFVTLDIYEEDDNTSEFNTSLNNIKTNTEDSRKIERTQQSTESILSLEITNAINFINNTSIFDENSDKDKNSTNSKEFELSVTNYKFTKTTTTLPKIDIINSNNLDNFSSTVTNAQNFSSNDTDLGNFSSDSTNNLSDTSPSNLHITTTPTSRPNLINWRRFYVDLLNFSNLAKKELETVAANDVQTTVEPDLVEQVVVSVV